MISKLSKGAGLSGCLSYVSEKDGAQQIGGNVAGGTASEQAREMQAVRMMNQDCKKPVFHASLSAAPGEVLTNEKWNAIADDYLRGMGFDTEKNQFVVYRHHDRDHDHIHIVANRINTEDLKVVSDSHDHRKTQTVCREIEQRHGLRQIESGKAKTLSAEREGGGGYVADIRKRVTISIHESGGDQRQFLAACEKNGLSVKLNQSKTTGRISGASFAADGGKYMKGSELGRGFGWRDLSNRLDKQKEKSLSTSQTTGPRTSQGGTGKAMAAGKSVGNAISGSITKALPKFPVAPRMPSAKTIITKALEL